MVIDAHSHLGSWPFPSRDIDSTSFISSMRTLGIDRSVISSSKALYYDFKEGNKDLAEILSPEDGLFGYIAVNLNYEKDSIKEIEKYASDPRFIGVKAHPMINRRTLDSLQAMHIVEVAAKKSLPLLVHTHSSADFESPRHLASVLTAFPDLQVIVAHTGGDDWLTASELISLSDTVCFEFSCSCTTPDKVLFFLEEAGEDRLLFGTDSNLFLPEYALGFFEALNLPSEIFSKLMGLNAQRIFRFPDEIKGHDNGHR